MSCEERRDAVLLLAAGLLGDAEAAELRAHFAGGCPACAAHLAEARAVQAALDLAAGGPVPVPALRGELLRRIHRVPSSAPARPRAFPLERLAIAAGLGALLAAPIGWYAASHRYAPLLQAKDAELGQAHQKEAALEQEIDETRTDRDEVDGELAEMEAHSRIVESDLKRTQRQVSLLADAKVVSLDLRGTPAQPGAHARVFWRWDDYYCYLHAEQLGPLAAPSVYALWIDTERGNRILAGTFAPEDGEATLWVQLPRDIGRAVRAEITLEPGAPGPKPAGPPQLSSGAVRPS